MKIHNNTENSINILVDLHYSYSTLVRRSSSTDWSSEFKEKNSKSKEWNAELKHRTWSTYYEPWIFEGWPTGSINQSETNVVLLEVKQVL